MRIRINRYHFVLNIYLVMLFLSSFNFEGLAQIPFLRSILGEFSPNIYFYVSILFLLTVFIMNSMLLKNIQLPTYFTKFLFFFYISILFSTLINYSNILFSEYKLRSCIQKFMVQVLSSTYIFFLATVVFIVLWKLCEKYGFKFITKKIYKCMDILIIFAILFCLIEYINSYIVTFQGFDNIIKFMHANERDKRIAFVTSEPSKIGTLFLAIYLPRVLIKLNDNKFVSWLMFIGVTGITYFSKSRSAYMVYIVCFIFFIFFSGKKITKSKVSIVVGILTICVSIGVIYLLIKPQSMQDNQVFNIVESVFKFSRQSDANESNLARYGFTQTAFSMGLDNPFGVGLGQFGANAASYFDLKYMTQETYNNLYNVSAPWPLAHNLYASLFAEIGFIGVSAWLYIWFYLLIKLYKIYNKLLKCNDKMYETNFVKMLLVMIIAVLIYGFSASFISQATIWCTLSLSMFAINYIQKMGRAV